MAVTYLFRPVLPAGSSFSGQLNYDLTSLEIPKTLIQKISHIDYNIVTQYINKYTGAETKKYRIANASGQLIEYNINIVFKGGLERWVSQVLKQLAYGANGAGFQIEFYDDFATNKQYTGRWTNAASFTANTEINNGAAINLNCWDVQDV